MQDIYFNIKDSKIVGEDVETLKSALQRCPSLMMTFSN